MKKLLLLTLLLSLYGCGNGEPVGSPGDDGDFSPGVPPQQDACGYTESQQVGVRICLIDKDVPQIVTLINYGSSAVSLEDWTLQDASASTYTFGALDSIDTGDTLEVSGLGFTIDTNDTIYLKDDTGTLKDSRTTN